MALMRVLPFVMAASLCISLSGCLGSKVTQANYDKIETGVAGFGGMNVEKVKEILGEPSEQKSGGLDLVGVGVNSRALVWKDGDRTITIVFVNNTATVKSQTNL